MAPGEGSSGCLGSTPLLDGYHVPAEWETHERTWMLWPVRPDTWKESARPAQLAFAAVAKAIARFEPVTVGVPSSQLQSAQPLLDATGIGIAVIEQDDAWIRDTGPTFVVGGTRSESSERQRGMRNVRGVDWSFNAWGGEFGGCFSNWDKDDAIASTVLGLVGADRYKANMVLEGGSVHVDGEGTVITTEECLLNPNRNPTFTKSEIEKHLRDYLGVKLVLWLGQGVTGDVDTDGHVDNLVAFVHPGEVVLHWTDNTEDPQHAVSLDALRRLEAFIDARGRQLKVHKCPLPGPLHTTEEDVSSLEHTLGSRERAQGDRLAASYVNFYLANGAVILPGYGVPEDEAAVRLFKAIYPEREVIQVDTRAVALGGGNIHCITQQQPVGATRG
ncbi:agmatine deiminase [Ectocarpus siliculosus]|uniref:Agmatine deiminase n=1 Tax=Ectocarpus siliculosus TaxID=2880 RepID=D7G474_ECTSI|nr:agmatine deiminase [Ectocarpus siliculosus]|eukprot:CBJ27089.1 agmatine deiminase [Ectocarpus siliculosus]